MTEHHDPDPKDSVLFAAAHPQSDWSRMVGPVMTGSAGRRTLGLQMDTHGGQQRQHPVSDPGCSGTDVPGPSDPDGHPDTGLFRVRGRNLGGGRRNSDPDEPRRDGRATTVCVVRHGETDWNVAGRLQGREDIPLNAHGREQARLTGQALAVAGWEVVLTSPLRRAAETARIIADVASVPRVVEIADLVERDYGVASGLTRAQKQARFADGVVPGEESRASARDRSLAVLVSWASRHPGGRILVVTHGGVIGALLTALSGGAIAVAPGSLGNGCVNVLHHVDGGWRVVTHNVVDHLVAARQGGADTD